MVKRRAILTLRRPIHPLQKVDGFRPTLLVEHQHPGPPPGARLIDKPPRRHPEAVGRMGPVDMPNYPVVRVNLDLAAPTPNHLLQTLDEIVRESVLLPPERRVKLRQGGFGECDSQTRVLFLKTRVGADLDAREARINPDDRERDLLLDGAFLQHPRGVGDLFDGKCGRAGGFHDAGLVPGDLVDGLAEHEDVVDGEGGDARGDGLWDDVGGVELAAYPRLEDDAVDALGQEGVEGQQGDVAGVDGTGGQRDGLREEGGGAEAVPDLEEVAGEEGFRDGFRVEADALADGDEVRGREVAYFGRTAGGRETVVGEDRVGEGARAPFAFGSGDVDYV